MRIELFRSQWPEQFFTTKRKANFSFVSWHSVRAINTAHNNTIYICKINKYLKKLALWDKITKITTRFIWESLRNSIWKWNQINITSPGYRKLLEIKKKTWLNTWECWPRPYQCVYRERSVHKWVLCGLELRLHWHACLNTRSGSKPLRAGNSQYRVKLMAAVSQFSINSWIACPASELNPGV